MKHRESSIVKSSIEEAPKFELTALLPHRRYVFLGKGDSLPLIIELDLNMQQVECLVEVLKRFKRAIGWPIQDIIDHS